MCQHLSGRSSSFISQQNVLIIYYRNSHHLLQCQRRETKKIIQTSKHGIMTFINKYHVRLYTKKESYDSDERLLKQ